MAPTLASRFRTPEELSSLADDVAALLDREVARASGLSGLALQGAYKLLGGARPGLVRGVIGQMLPDFLVALEPAHQKAVGLERSLAAHFAAEAPEVARALLAVADARVARSKNEAVRRTYGRLRGAAERQVGAVAAGLGELLDRHSSPPG